MEWRRHGSNADCGARMAGIRAVAGWDCDLKGSYKLAGGGTLRVGSS